MTEEKKKTIDKEKIISDVVDLYTNLINGERSEIKAGLTAYKDEYNKILRKLRDYIGEDSDEDKKFVCELIDDINPKGNILFKETEIKKIELGLKKIMKKFDVEIPEKKERRQENIPPFQNIIQASQSMNNEINISNEVKIEVDQAINEFEEEASKPDPNPAKLKKLFEIIKKGAGYGIIKVIEVLLKKVFGI